MAENISKVNSELKSLCKQILEISPNIRYIGIINRFGRTLAGQLRNGIVPFLKHEDMKNELYVHSMIYNLRKNYEKSVGETQFILISNSLVDIVSFYSNDLIYYISLEKNLDKNELYPLIDKIKNLVK
ncbi:MAG TPA: hypothetical protein VFV86_02605, partial [Nitrososphaeraceae archaeon]|nr:hypothetical protein [Nitrososphaeraceae archaeon]